MAETVHYKNKAVAIFIASDEEVPGVSYITAPQNAFQIGLHHRKKSEKVEPHIHVIDTPLTISEIQELLFIISGSIRLTLYTKTGTIIATKILKSGESVLLMREGHSVEYLEETRMFEVKQGPYPGVKNAKLFIRDGMKS